MQTETNVCVLQSKNLVWAKMFAGPVEHLVEKTQCLLVCVTCHSVRVCVTCHFFREYFRNSFSPRAHTFTYFLFFESTYQNILFFYRRENTITTVICSQAEKQHNTQTSNSCTRVSFGTDHMNTKNLDLHLGSGPPTSWSRKFTHYRSISTDLY